MGQTNKLTAKAVENAKPKERPYKLPDGGGLYLYCTPSGGKLWRMNYRFNGKEKTLALGKFPLVSLLQARLKALEVKGELSKGIDPAEQRRAAKKAHERQAAINARTFEKVFWEWFTNTQASAAPKSRKDILNRVKNNFFPCIGTMPIETIKPAHLMDCLRGVEKRGAFSMAHDLARLAKQIFRYAMSLDYVEYNPASDLVYAMHKKRPVEHLPAILTNEGIADFFHRAEQYPNLIIQYLLKMLVYVFVRPSELRGAEWSEIDFQEAQWIIPAARTKKRREHIVPLAPQVLKMFEELREVSLSTKYCFPSPKKDAPLTESATRYALRKIGYQRADVTLHGFRSTASTILNESGLFRRDVIERQLAHVESNQSRKPYNRAEYMQERVELVQWWANFLDSIQAQGCPLPTAGSGAAVGR